MKTLILASAITLMASAAMADGIAITPNRSSDSILGNPEQFSGNAVIDMMWPASELTGASGAVVNFAPGARTAWHTHPAGQTLVITEGKGWIQEEGGEKRDLNPGDVVWIPIGVKHWHGATASTGMSHFAISYVKDGSNVTWGDLVSDEEFGS